MWKPFRITPTHSHSTVFRLTPSGLFVPLPDEVVKLSANDIVRHLNYHPDQVHTMFGDFEAEDTVKHVVVEIFTSNIVFVMTKPLKKLGWRDVNQFLNKHDIKSIFRDYTVEDILKTGIENQSLDITFLSRVLNIKKPALWGIFSVPSIGYDLFFNGGILEHFTPLDGLNCWAKMWKEINPQLAKDYFDQAAKYWGNDNVNALLEVNMQANAFASTPNGVKNAFTYLHQTEYGLIDYAILVLTHYDISMTLDDFKIVNRGRYEEVTKDSDNNQLSYYQVGYYVYKFNKEGEYSGHDET